MERKKDFEMTSPIKKVLRKIDLNFYMIYGVGTAGFLLPLTRPLMTLLTPLVLFLTASYAIYMFYNELSPTRKKVFLVWAGGVFALTMGLEILGVQFGLVFGEYEYGAMMGPGIMGVPFIIGVNWLIVVMGAVSLARVNASNIWKVALVASLYALIFDVLMEPAAINLGFWQWAGDIPLKNYLAWVIITFVSGAVAGKLKLEISGYWLKHLLFAQFMFFTSIRLFMFFNLF